LDAIFIENVPLIIDQECQVLGKQNLKFTVLS